MNKITKKILQVALCLIIFYFIGKIFFDYRVEIQVALARANYPWLLVSLGATLAVLAFQGYTWSLLLKKSGQNVSLRDSFSTFFRSNIVRYLPGGVWGFFSRTYQTAKLGPSRSQSLFLIFMESALAVMTGSATFLLTQPATPYQLYLNILFAILATGAAVFLIRPDYFIALIKITFKKDLGIITLPKQQLLGISFLILAQWLVFGLGLFAAGRSLNSIGLSQIWPISGIFAASWVIGFVVFIAPSGLGAREGALIILLGNFLPIAEAAVIAVVYRCLIILAEVLIFFFAVWAGKKTPPPIPLP